MTHMWYRLAADLTLVLHLLFIIFVLCGGWLCLRHRRWAWLHLPSMVWGVWVEWSGATCPLTPVESSFRQLSSGSGYSGGFVEHYLVPLVYPAALSHRMQWTLGAIVVAVNLAVYLFVFSRRANTSRQS